MGVSGVSGFEVFENVRKIKIAAKWDNLQIKLKRDKLPLQIKQYKKGTESRVSIQSLLAQMMRFELMLQFPALLP